MSPRPECERLAAVAPFSNHVGDFLDWLVAQGFVLAKVGCPHGYLDPTDCADSKHCRRGDEHTVLWAQHVHPERLLAEFYGIDLAKVERERSALLAEIQAAAS